MKKFNKLLSEAIDQAEEPLGPYTSARDLLTQVKDTEQIIQDLQLRISHLKEQLISSLGSEVRKRQPKLEIGLQNGTCSTGYRSKRIMCKPDFEKGTWNISGSPFAAKFARTYPHLSKMSDDLGPLAHAIADYFNDRYRTLK